MREFLFQAAAQVGERCGFAGAWRLGALAGWVLWLVLPRRRRMATQAVQRHLRASEAEARRIARQSFMHTGRSFFEAFLTRRVDWQFMEKRLRLATPETMAHLQEEGGPAVLACAHLGSWELLAGLLQLMMPPGPKAIVVREGRDEALNQLMRRQRGRPGVAIIPHRGAVVRVLRTLRQQGVCAFLVDHNTQRSEAVFLPFLEDTAAVNAGPALLAVRTGARIWPVFLLREGIGRYVLHVDEPLHTAGISGTAEEKVAAAAGFYTQAVARCVCRNPEQWFWMHRRWKTRPEEGGQEGESQIEKSGAK